MCVKLKLKFIILNIYLHSFTNTKCIFKTIQICFAYYYSSNHILLMSTVMLNFLLVLNQYL